MNEFLRTLTTRDPMSMSVVALLYHLLLAFVLAKPLAFVYARTHQGTSYSRSFVQSLVLLPLIITAVMLAVGDSMARAFGLFGALALIRFRTPIKDSRDTVFLFLAVAVGITVGVQNTALAVVSTASTLLCAVYLYGVRFGERVDHDAVLRFTLEAAPDKEASRDAVLGRHCRGFDLVSLNEAHPPGTFDFTYQLHLRHAGSPAPLIADLRQATGAQQISLLVQNQHEEV
ncbi:MAG: DUF4956 domain-containing protein [Planctomycetota bacterium]